MKKKSLLMTIVAFTALGLVGCNNKTSTPSVSDQPATETPTSTVNTNDDTITRRGNTTFEVDQTPAFRFNVTSATRNKLVNVEIDNPNVAAVSLTDGVDDHANNVSKVTLLGIEPGTVNRKVTSVETGNSKTFVLTVIAAKPTLKEALTALASAKNYTFTGAPEQESLKNNFTTSIVKRTEKALTNTAGDGKNLWNFKSSEKGVAGYDRYGLAVNEDGQAFYLDKVVRQKEDSEETTTDENFRNPAELAVTTNGFLNAENFAGDSSAFNAYSFYSFSIINPSWATADKADDNIYNIKGSEKDTNAAFLACRLWNLVDPSGMVLNRQLKQDNKFVDAATWIDTTVQVNGLNDIVVTITPTANAGLKKVLSEDATSYGDYPTMVGKLSDIGTTVMDQEIKNFLATKYTVERPSLNSNKKAIQTALGAKIYRYDGTISYYKDPSKKETAEASYSIYYNDNYRFYEVPEESIAQFKKDTGKDWTDDTLGFANGTGYGIYKDKKVHKLTYVPASGAEEAKVIVGDVRKAKTPSGTIVEVTLNSRNEFSPAGVRFDGGLASLVDSYGSLYRLSDKADQFWDGDNTPYYSNYRSNSTCFDPFCQWFRDETGSSLSSKLQELGNDITYFTLINTKTETDETISELNFQLDAMVTRPSGGYSGYIFEFSMKDIGTAKSTYDSLIKAALAA